MRRGAKSKGFVHLGRRNRKSDDPDKHLKDFVDFFSAPGGFGLDVVCVTAQLAEVTRSSEAMAFL
jgi:hypothetical protein